MMSDTIHILLVGHCGPDAHLLASAARGAVPGAKVVAVPDQQRLDEAMATASLLLVNRVLDGGFEAESGIDLIRSLTKRNGAAPPALLISNYEDAQRDAEAAGARPGFGKRAVMTDIARARIRTALGLE